MSSTTLSNFWQLIQRKESSKKPEGNDSLPIRKSETIQMTTGFSSGTMGSKMNW